MRPTTQTSTRSSGWCRRTARRARRSTSTISRCVTSRSFIFGELQTSHFVAGDSLRQVAEALRGPWAQLAGGIGELGQLRHHGYRRFDDRRLPAVQRLDPTPHPGLKQHHGRCHCFSHQSHLGVPNRRGAQDLESGMCRTIFFPNYLFFSGC